ncbi:MAG: radical SAM protein [Myxococcales bacterium]
MPDLILSNYGLRLSQQPDCPEPELVRLREAVRVSWDGSPAQQQLIDRGLAQTTELDRDAVLLRYRRNPLECLTRVVFEFTTACQLRCAHCRNAGVPTVTERNPERLCAAADLLVPLGLRRFDFIGGEVSRFGDGWLQVVSHLRRHPGTRVSLLTNGWFLEQEGFVAAGQRYPDDAAYLRELAAAGVTHLTFSLDGPREVHDRWRGVPGLCDRILGAFDRVRDAGLSPQVSLVVHAPELVAPGWVSAVARALYGERSSARAGSEELERRLLSDPMNYVSNFIDTGRGRSLRQGLAKTDWVHDATLRCKAFFRPSPSLRIQASGALALCPLPDCGEGYGNLADEGGLLRSLNRMQDAIPYLLHADGSIARYRRFLDPAIFGDRVDHACALRAAVTMIARRMIERGVDEGDDVRIREINLEVAARCGFTAP